MRIWLVFLGLIASACLWAADNDNGRPDENEMFGGPPPAASGAATTAAPRTSQPAPTPAASPKSDDSVKDLVPDTDRDAFATGEVVDNPLTIGGIYYQRAIVSAEQGVNAAGTPMSAPLQFDGFMDARPNDRIRAYVDARLLYDPTSGSSVGNNQTSSTSAAPTSLGLPGTTTSTNSASVVLDQAWLKFDVDRTVFITAGKQHVKWGVSRFWNPTDFLSTQKRDPLLPYDLRLGNFMAKFDVPIESQKMNVYAIALLDNPNPAPTLGQGGAAFRVERLFGNAEVGLDAVLRGDMEPVYGADVSSPLGPLDGYLELSCLSGGHSLYQLPSSIAPNTDINSVITTQNLPGPAFQVSGGLSYDFAWEDNRQATLGVEYFYNSIGYSDPHAYPALIFLGQYQPFYTGKNYAAIYLTAEGPDAEKHTSYTFSTLGNLSDMSFISRVDFSWRVLTYLTFEAYADVHYGTDGGEFNFSLSTPALTYQNNPIPAIYLPRTLYDLGIGLRVSF